MLSQIINLNQNFYSFKIFSVHFFKMPPKKAPKQRDNQPKQEQKNRKEVHQFDFVTLLCIDELRKVDVVLDKKFQVPLCYVKFFTEKKHKPKVCNGLIIITIAGRNIKNETKKYTKISWDDDDNPFQNKNLQEIFVHNENHFLQID